MLQRRPDEFDSAAPTFVIIAFAVAVVFPSHLRAAIEIAGIALALSRYCPGRSAGFFVRVGRTIARVIARMLQPHVAEGS